MTPALQRALQKSSKAVFGIERRRYTWGSNLSGCLGHAIRDKFVEHTAEPGHASGFGAIVERVGRGMVRAYALGREFTVVATYPYEGPSEDVARKLMEEEAIRLDMLALEEEQEATIRGTQRSGGVDDGTLASGDDGAGSGDDEDGGTRTSGRGGPALLLDKGMNAQKDRGR